MKRFGNLSVRRKKIRCSLHTNTHIGGSRGSSRSSNKLVRKAGDKWARAHCPGIRDEQRCENVTTNSFWSSNVTFPLYFTLPPISQICFCFPPFLIFLSFSLSLFSIYSPLFSTVLFPLWPPLLPSHHSALLSFSSPQREGEGESAEKKN